MKKFFMYAVAAVATMSLTSCLSEEETNLTNGEKGYISLDVQQKMLLLHVQLRMYKKHLIPGQSHWQAQKVKL